jgi:5-methylcytosine-specific restriction endonuclease McrA
MKPAKRRKVLSVVHTDSTFELAEQQGRRVWVGKCLHCRAKLWIAEGGEPLGKATIEHIVPRTHGGTDEPRNLGLACKRCNNEKGVRHDHKRADDPRLLEIIARLQERRDRRWREAP